MSPDLDYHSPATNDAVVMFLGAPNDGVLVAQGVLRIIQAMGRSEWNSAAFWDSINQINSDLLFDIDIVPHGAISKPPVRLVPPMESESA